MKQLNKRIPLSLKSYFDHELVEAKLCFRQGNLQQSWRHLERAHILGQPFAYEHSLSHWKMLLFGIHTKNAKEIIGQLPRLVFGGVKSFVGKVPIGNTGAANIPPLMPMEIPADLQYIIDCNEK